MRTLVEMLHNEMVRSGYFGANGRDDEMIAGIVGAVQEWLGQDAMFDVFDVDTQGISLPIYTQMDALIREAGKGLGDVASP